jgi:REP element-mobilizing transposase RayT
MVLAYHVIFGTYGFWLPNDPRGSWSDFVWSWELFLAGGSAAKTNTRKSVAAKPHNYQKRIEVKEHLKYPPVVLTGQQARAVAHGFAKAITISHYPVYACSILPEHVHLVIGRCHLPIERVVKQLKQNATIHLREENLYPVADTDSPTPWAASCWRVYLNDESAIENAIRYVENNPIKDGKKTQQWTFVQKYQSR